MARAPPKPCCAYVSLAQTTRKVVHLTLRKAGKHSPLGGCIATLKKVRVLLRIMSIGWAMADSTTGSQSLDEMVEVMREVCSFINVYPAERNE